MKVTAPYDAYVPDIGQVVEGEEYEVDDTVGVSLGEQGWKTSGGPAKRTSAVKRGNARKG